MDKVQRHVVNYLALSDEPEGLDEQQMEEFERLIEEWIAPYEDLH